MCFDCQQSVEKALKGFMVSRNIKFEWTHDIGTLIKTLEDNNIEVPDNIKRSASLSVYAVRTRYPGEEEPITKEEFQEALSTADTVFEWVKNQLEAVEPPEPMSPQKIKSPPGTGKAVTGKNDAATERSDIANEKIAAAPDKEKKKAAR